MHPSDHGQRALAKRGYKALRFISSGSFGTVMKARRLSDRRLVAIKSVPIQALSFRSARTSLLVQEIQILSSVHHPHIVEFIESFTENVTLGFRRDNDVVYIVTEFLEGGDLFDRISKSLLSEEEALEVARQLLSALIHLKTRHVCHRDLKLENVCFVRGRCGEIHVKLIDFGYAAVLDEKQKLSGESVCGTLNYCPPQLLHREQYDAHKMDVWSLGVVLYAATCGRFPFYGLSREEIKDMTTKQDPHFAEPQWIARSPAFKLYLLRLMSRDEENRLDLTRSLAAVKKIQDIHLSDTESKSTLRTVSHSRQKLFMPARSRGYRPYPDLSAHASVVI